MVSYPSYGFRAADGNWRVHFIGLAFQKLPINRRQKMLVKMLAGVMKVGADDVQSPNFQARIAPFFVEADKGYRIQIEIGDRRFFLKGKTTRSGRFSGWLRLCDSFCREHVLLNEHGRYRVPYRLSVDHPHAEPIDCSVDLLPRKGISVISDIDDTIKESAVGNRRELLLNTFLRDFRTVDGMVDVYRGWHEAGADFHYISSSPWQLFQPLHQMQRQFGLPPGTMHLRNFRLRDQLFKKLLVLRRRGKATEIKRLVRNLPLRKFILVGDSSEKDPEIYRKICRAHPDQIIGVFIRNVSSRPLDWERTLRLKQVAGGGRCAIFASAAQLEQAAATLFEDKCAKSVTR